MVGAKKRPESLISVSSRDAVGSPRDAAVMPETPMDTPNVAWLKDVATEMSKHSTGVSVRDRTYHFTKYKKCFVGARGVEWLVQHEFADDVESAVSLGQEMLNKGLLEHVHDDQRYLNRNSAFYRFTVRRRRRRRQMSQATLNVRLASAMELKQRLETTEAMVDDLCESVVNLTADNESMRQYITSLETASRAQVGVAKRGILAQFVVLASSAVSYVLMVEAAGLKWSKALGTVCAVAVPLIWLCLNRCDRAEANARRPSNLALGTLMQTLSANKATLGVSWEDGRTYSMESSSTQRLQQSSDDSSNDESDSDTSNHTLERFDSAKTSLASDQSSISAAQVMARRMLRRGSDTMLDQHQCWSSPPPGIFSVRSISYLVNKKKQPGSQPLFELLRVDFAAIDGEHQPNISAQPGTPVDLGLRVPNCGDSESDDDSLGVRILEQQDASELQSFKPKYFGTYEACLTQSSIGPETYLKMRLDALQYIACTHTRSSPATSGSIHVAVHPLTCRHKRTSILPGVDMHACPCVCACMCVLRFGWHLSYRGLQIHVHDVIPVVQFQLPGYSLVLYWVQRTAFDLSPNGPPADRLAAKFFNSDARSDAAHMWRKNHLKMTPHITEGGYVVKTVVGSRPVTIAKDEALSTLHVGPQHVELDVDVTQTYLAQKVASVLQGFAPGLVIDLGFIIEGKDEEPDDVTMGSNAAMLPEQLLCVARLVRPRLTCACHANRMQTFARVVPRTCLL